MTQQLDFRAVFGSLTDIKAQLQQAETDKAQMERTLQQAIRVYGDTPQLRANFTRNYTRLVERIDSLKAAQREAQKQTVVERVALRQLASLHPAAVELPSKKVKRHSHNKLLAIKKSFYR